MISALATCAEDEVVGHSAATPKAVVEVNPVM